jgi:hypothetical protein
MHDETLEATQSQAFLESAAVQQKVARFEAKSWAPIYEFGTSPSGPFYVTDRYDFSVQWLVDEHVKLGAEGIHNIANSIVRGLLALQQACQRPHGNLKSTNILIAGRRDLSKATIVLCDPLPDRHLDPSAHAKADLRRLGEILHQVVVHGSVPRITGYQVPASEHWRKLGKQNEAWRHLCNRLLQANVESTPITLEDLANQLAALTPRRSRRALLIAGGIAFPVSILLAILFWRIFFPPPDPKVVEQAQKDLAQAESWLKPLGKVVDEHISPGNRPSYRQQQKYLADLLATTGDRILVGLLHNILSCAGYFASPRNPTQANRARNDVISQLFRTDTRWSWLSDLEKKHAPRLRQKNCILLAEFLENTIKKIPPNEPNRPTEKICKEICEGFEVALDLRTKWPKNIGPNDLDRLEPRTVAGDPNLAEEITNVTELVERLSLLPDHYQLKGDKLAAWDKSLPNLEKVMENLEAQLRGAAKKVDDPNLEKLAKYRKELPTIEAAPTEGRYRLIVALQKWVDTIDNPAGWYKRTREEAKTEISKSPRLNGWYASYVNERTGDPDTFVQTYKAGDTLFSNLKGEVKQTRESFILFTEDFNGIETALKACYMLEEELPSIKDTLQMVCDRWRKNQVFDKVLKNEPYGTAITDLRDRVQKLEDISREETVDDLLNEAKTGRWLEARYAAWRRLDASKPPAWPLTEPQWKEEANIQSRLKNDLEQVTGLADRRGTEFRSLCETRERTYWNSSLNELVSKVEARASGVAILSNIGRARPQTNATLDKLREFERVLQSLVGFLTSDTWPRQYDLAEFRRDHAGYFADANPFDAQDLESWRKALPGYRSLPDPRDHTRKDWAKVDASLKLTENLGKLRTDAEKAGKKEQLQKWEQLQKCCDNLGQRFRKVWDPNVSAIERDGTRIGDWNLIMADVASAPVKPEELLRGILTPAWDKQKDKVSLPVLAEMVQRCIAPAYCKWVDLVDGRFVFRPEAGQDKFEPLLLRAMKLKSLGDFADDAGLRTEFFVETTKTDDPSYGWPRYIQAVEDSSVILRFVPQGSDSFYMAIREITNEQYRTYLQRRNPPDMGIRNTELSGHPYSSRFHSTSREWTDRLSDPNAPRLDHPVVWVTYEGAKDYATAWLGADLPTVREHQCAAGLVDSVTANYSDPDKYHVRAQLWGKAAKALMLHLKDDQYTGITIAPSGADDPEGEARAVYDSADLGNLNRGRYAVFWPTASWAADKIAKRDLKTDGYTIYDLIGNVWEWCEDRTCCGGSCLSSLKDLSKVPVCTPTRGSDADLGFRVVVRPPKAG